MEKTNRSPTLDLKGKVTEYESYGDIVYYVCCFKTGEEFDAASWAIKKRYSDFVTLQKNLSVKYSDLPELPAATWFKVKEANQLEDRKKLLNDYLQTLCKKESLSTDADFHAFINLEENLHNKVLFNKEKLQYQFPDVEFGVKEFVIVEDQKIVMAVCSEENIQNRITSYWDNIAFSLFGKTEESAHVGALVVFKIISQNPWHVEKMFVKNFKSQALCVHFDTTTNTLAVGLSSGKIRVFEIPKDFKFNKGVVYEQNSIQAHTSSVTGVCMDPILGYIYSVGRDGRFCVSDRTSCEHYWTKSFDKFELTCLYHDKERNRIFIGDSGGLIHVFSIKKYPPKRLTSIKTSVTTSIKSIICSDDHKKLFAGTKDGTIMCFSLGGYGKEKKDTVEYPYVLKGKTKCATLQWDESSQGILAGNESGNCAVWSPETNKCEYVFNAHLNKVTSLYWNPGERKLISGSVDGKIKVWQLPKVWVDQPVPRKDGLGGESNIL